MRVLVVGASGRTGRLVVQEARAAGHRVRALARSLEPEAADDLEILRADVCAPGVAERAVAGMDAVVVVLSMVRTSDSPWSRITTPRDLHSQAADRLVTACEAAGVRRYVSVSAHGVGASRSRAGWAFLALVHSSNIGVAYDNLAVSEARVEDSSLDWTLVRPTRLTMAPGTGCWTADAALRTSSRAHIPREDLARFLVQSLTDPRWSRTAVSLTSRAPGAAAG
ncbi:MAG: NAD(P)-binding oxidoreductase [Myxococcota bacterium]|nr:NAD(P)-binding oxidoreductase [Myxococcota bacterium]